jgi:aspartyl-tRNA(Asn)/glutamyl-tRNA(Gln) amidotransferase subunit A
MSPQPTPPRSIEEMVATARVAGVELDNRYVQLAADAMAVWWDEVVAVRALDLGGMAHRQPLEPRTAPRIHAKHPVPLGRADSTPHSTPCPTPAGASTQPTDLADCTVTELLAHFAAGRASPTEAFNACVARIEKVNPSINAVMHVALDSATAQARVSDQRWLRGEARPLEGIPYGLKDNICTAGIVSTGGSRVLAQHVPDASAFAVEQLDAAGAVMLAKLASTEFACGGALSPWYGAVHNPWDLDRFAGSSSSGPGGAVGARLVPFALGTDTLGSIRVPAACTGVVGWKPTYGAVSRRGVMPLSWTMDHVGPLARSVEDAARILDIISAHDIHDDSSFAGNRPDLQRALTEAGDLRGLKIGLARSYYEPLSDAPVIAAMDHVIEVLRGCGATIIDVEIANVEHSFGAGWLALLCEGASLHEDLWTRPNEYDPGLVFRLLVGKLAPATDYVRALRMRTLLQNSFDATFESVDAILFPGLVGASPRYDDLFFNVNGTKHALQKMHARFTGPGNVTGHPALCLPSGIGRDGMPVAFQIYAPAHRDDVCARIGHAFQRQTTHHQSMPTALATLLNS